MVRGGLLWKRQKPQPPSVGGCSKPMQMRPCMPAGQAQPTRAACTAACERLPPPFNPRVQPALLHTRGSRLISTHACDLHCCTREAPTSPHPVPAHACVSPRAHAAHPRPAERGDANANVQPRAVWQARGVPRG
eukprot:365303-Chlamydomonas_euryale.AAC.60